MHLGLTQRPRPGPGAGGQCLPRHDADGAVDAGRRRSRRSSAAQFVQGIPRRALRAALRADAPRRDAGVQLVRFGARLRLVPDDELSHAGRAHRFVLRRLGQSRAGPSGARVATSKPTSASSAAASPAVRPRCTWPSAATTSCCSRVTASAGARPGAAAARRSSATPASQDKLVAQVGTRRREAGCSTSRSRRWT